jgi:uncharacterized protein
MIAAHLRGASLVLGSARKRQSGSDIACTVRRLAGRKVCRKSLLDNSLLHRAENGSRPGRREQHARRVRSPEVLRRALFALFLSLSFQCNAAETIPPKPDRYFNDYAGVVSRGAAERLNTQLAQFERDTSNQVVVAVYRKMQSESSIEDYAQRVAQAWQVGQKDKRNGVVLLVFLDDRKASIQVGYGLEGALPDVIAFDIRERHMNPHFRNGDYEGGLIAAVDLICKAIRGEYKGSGRTNAETRTDNGGTAGLLVFLIVVIVFLLLTRASRRFGGYRYTGLGGPYVSGGWGSSGGGWSSGSSSGGFGGFSSGGGSFGGGGSSGSW